jgi:hypothetical protein
LQPFARARHASNLGRFSVDFEAGLTAENLRKADGQL